MFDNDMKNLFLFLQKFMDMLEAHLGKTSEIVLHDFTKGVENTIIDIRNGEITGRKVGGSGTNMGLEVARGSVENGNRYNYITKTKNGKILRSSSVYFRDQEGKVLASLCINTDITESLRMENFLKELNRLEGTDKESEEVFLDDVGQLLEYYLLQGQKEIGKVPENMTKEEKYEFIKYLDKKGAFLIAKSGERVQEFLNISKYLMYKYLDMAREDHS